MRNLQTILSKSLSLASRKSYRHSWDIFIEFCSKSELPCSIPLSQHVLLMFISYLDLKELAPATISSHMSALSYVHKVLDFKDTTKNFLVTKALVSCYKKYQKIDKRLPITMDILDKIIFATEHVLDNHYEITMFKAMFSLAFHAFLRIGEITVNSLKQENINLLKLENVNITDVIEITFTHFKHYKGQPFTLQVKPKQKAKNCPVSLLKKYLNISPCNLKNKPLFQTSPGIPVLRSKFDKILKQTLSFCNINNTNYKGHSFRIGSASEASRQGLNDDKIKELGRWNSNAYKKYIRLSYRVSSF